MLRSTRGVALITLAMLNVFTLAAGVVLARMLPPRLALLRPVRVADRPEVRADPVLGSAGGGPMPTSSGLNSALTGTLSSAALGSGVAAVVADASGNVVYSRNGSELASAGVHREDRHRDRGPRRPRPRRPVQHPGGQRPGRQHRAGWRRRPDARGRLPPASDYPQPATLKDLAARTASALRAEHRSQVDLDYDTSLYTGPGMAPGWPQSYVTSGDVTQITSLEVDQGRLTSSGAPEDADDPVNLQPRSTDPVGMAVSAFQGYLARDGISVTGTPSATAVPARAAGLASVSSPPLSALVEWMMLESNNVIAENLARHVAIEMEDPASFAGAAAAETAVLRRLGAGTGVRLVDGSGLSPADKIAPDTLIRLLGIAASPEHATLRAAITGLPVAGFSGTLSAGQSVFGSIGGPARGVVRAKTGNLSTVAALAGFAYDADGRLLAFVFNAANIPSAADLQTAADTLNGAAAVIASCGCR